MEKVARLFAHLILAGVIGAFGITLVVISRPQDDSALTGIILCAVALAYLCWSIREYLPKEIRAVIIEAAAGWWKLVTNLSKIGTGLSAVAFAGCIAVWVLAGIRNFLTAPIGFKEHMPEGALEGLADAAFIPSIAVLACCAIAFVIGRSALTAVQATVKPDNARSASASSSE